MDYSKHYFPTVQDLRTLPNLNTISRAAPKSLLPIVILSWLTLLGIGGWTARGYFTLDQVRAEKVQHSNEATKLQTDINEVQSQIRQTGSAKQFLERQEEYLRDATPTAPLIYALLSSHQEYKFIKLSLSKNGEEVQADEYMVYMEFFNDRGSAPLDLRDKVLRKLHDLGIEAKNPTARIPQDTKRVQVTFKVRQDAGKSLKAIP